MAEANSSARITLSEDKLLKLFADFKLELFKEMNTFALKTDLEKVKDRSDERDSKLDHRLRRVEDQILARTATSKAQKVWIGIAVTFVTAIVTTLMYIAAQGVHH